MMALGKAMALILIETRPVSLVWFWVLVESVPGLSEIESYSKLIWYKHFLPLIMNKFPIHSLGLRWMLFVSRTYLSLNTISFVGLVK